MEVSLLSCPVCLKPHFQGVDALRTSLISAATTHITCPVCNELFLGLDKLTIHLFSHISNNTLAQERAVQIDGDNEGKDQNQLKPVPPVETNVPANLKSNKIVCDICNFRFSDENILDLHQKLLHQTTPDKKTGRYSYHCHLCSKQFKMRGSLMVHLRVAHFGFVQSNHRIAHISNDNAKAKVFKDDNTETEIKLQQMELVSGEKQQPPVVMPSELEQEQQKIFNTSSGSKLQENKQWECEVCLKLFTTKYFLKKHKRLHTGEMPYYCSQCNKYFTFQQSYHKHMLYHSDDKPHVCTECGRAFKELSTLHNHERIHSGERPFSCETCGKCFRQRVSYLVHRRIHTGAMPYKCTACSKSFRYKVSQRSHKCPVSPPGNVIRTPDLVEKLKQHQMDGSKTTDQNLYLKLFYEEKPNTTNYQLTNDTKQVLKVGDCSDRFNFKQNLSGHLSTNAVPNISSNSEIMENRQVEGEAACFVNTSLPTESGKVTQTSVQQYIDYTVTSKSYLNDQSKIAFTSNQKVNTALDFTPIENNNPDFFALILSPVLPDVQSLCLSNNSASVQQEVDGINSRGSDEALQTINQESFKELLFGPYNK